MNFVVCAKDGAKLKADMTDRTPGTPVGLTCPECGLAYLLDATGLRPVAGEHHD